MNGGLNSHNWLLKPIFTFLGVMGPPPTSMPVVGCRARCHRNKHDAHDRSNNTKSGYWGIGWHYQPRRVALPPYSHQSEHNQVYTAETKQVTQYLA